MSRCLFTVLCLLIFQFSLSADVDITYKTSVKDTSYTTEWEEKDVGSTQVFTGESKKGKTVITMNTAGSLESFSYEDKQEDTAYTFIRQENLLKLSGKVKGKHMEKQYKIDKQNWIQDFSFAIRPFFASSDTTFKFVILNPYNFDINYMIAKKEKKEWITVDGTSFQAQKIVVSLTGFKSMFWSGQIWYNPENNELLRYTANEGPGTPVVILSLVVNESC